MPKGYIVPSGYMGYVYSEHKYILFATEGDYLEYIAENDCEPLPQLHLKMAERKFKED